MNKEIKRATGLLVIEVVNSNANGDPDRESDPRQRPNGIGEISPVSFKRSCVICWKTMTAFSSGTFQKTM
jgi:CRISPR/Cas system type I-B associated protein Csh2 (Cas7 group RAMP superfamily)